MRSASRLAALLGAILGLGLLPRADFADTSTKTPAPTDTPASTATASANDAAAKHLKRTGCLKDAKAKKLVGAEKTAYVKNCVSAP